MKKILSIALVCILSLGFINLGAQQLLIRECSENFTTEGNKAQQEIKYCNSEIKTGIGTGKAAALQAAIKFPSAFMGAYKDARVVKIKVGIMGEKISNTKVWLASSLTGKRFVEQSFVYTEGWNEVTLTTPYTIAAGDLVVGYDAETKATGDPAQIIGATDNKPINAENGGNIAIGGQWSTLAANKLPYNLCIIAVLEGDFPEYIDLGISSVKLGQYAKINTDVSLSGSLISSSNVPVTSYDVNYTINGGDSTTINVTGANVAPGATVNFSFPAFQFTAVGTYDVKITVLNVNGDKDKTLENNTITKTVIVYENSVKRKVIMEHFTTEKCPNCPAAEKYLTGLVGKNPDVIWISNHSGYGTDQYTVTEDYLWFFNTNMVYAPAIMLDQTWLAPDGDPGPVFFPANTYTPALVNERVATPAFVEVKFETFSYNPENRELTIKIGGDKLLDLPGKNIVLTAFVIEDGLHSDQTGTAKHEHVLRQIISKTWGDAVTFEGNKYYKEYTFKVNDNIKITNAKIAAFLSNYDNKNPNNCEIYNGEQVAFEDYKPAGSVKVETSTANEKYGRTSGDSYCMPGADVTLFAFPATGYVFEKWTLNGAGVSTDATYTINVPATGATDVEYVAVFEKGYEVRITVSPKNKGTVTGAGFYREGAEVTVTATPAEGYVFIGWKLGSDTISTASSYTFTMPKKVVAYTAMFKDPNSVNEVEELNFRAYPNPAKDFITVEGEYKVLSIIDITGKVVKTVTGQSNIDVKDLNNGIYILNIVGDGATKTQKIMISK